MQPNDPTTKRYELLAYYFFLFYAIQQLGIWFGTRPFGITAFSSTLLSVHTVKPDDFQANG